MTKTSYLIFFFLLLSLSVCHGQAQRKHEKKSYLDSANNFYQQADMPVYLFISNTPNREDAAPLKNVKNKNEEPQAMYLDGHGVHTLRHPDHRTGHDDVRFKMYADGRAPITKSQFKVAPKYVKNGMAFYGKGLKVGLTSTDEMTGVDEMLYSIDGMDYQNYANDLHFGQGKKYMLKYYSVDRVGNVEKARTKNFEVDLTPPETVYSLSGDRIEAILSPRAKITLKVTDTGSGVRALKYEMDENGRRAYTSSIGLWDLSDGQHTLSYQATDNVKNEEETKQYTFYLDKNPPIVTPEVMGDRFIFGGKDYFSGRTKLKLIAMDNKAGVKEVKYSINGGAYKVYTEPFYMPSKPGLHTVKFYAVDKVNNGQSGTYQRKVSSVYMDLSGPRLSHQFIGRTFKTRDTIFISPNTKVKVTGQDAQSGLKKLAYQLDGSGGETTYDTPIKVSEAGVHTLAYYGYDNVNNRNRAETFFVVDNEGPEVYFHFSITPLAQKEGIDVYSKHVVLFLAATDSQTGTERITYSLNGAAFRSFTGLIQGFRKGQKYDLRIKAKDKLGNESERQIQFYIEN